MQITLNQDEIIDAVVAYVHGQISVAPNQKIEVDLKAGRGENGFTATLDIRSMAVGLSTVVKSDGYQLNASKVSDVVANVSSAPEPAAEPVKAAAKKEEAAPKTTKASGLFGGIKPAEPLAPIQSSEPVGVLEDVVLPQQDPENTATFSSELDDASVIEETPAEEAPRPTSGIFKFAKG